MNRKQEDTIIDLLLCLFNTFCILYFFADFFGIK